jgi:hypothetical protein
MELVTDVRHVGLTDQPAIASHFGSTSTTPVASAFPFFFGLINAT